MGPKSGSFGPRIPAPPSAMLEGGGDWWGARTGGEGALNLRPGADTF